MTDEEIIEMAKQTGFYAPDAQHKGMLIAFARLIAEKQREECIKVIRDVLHDQSPSGMLAAAIRSQK